jgi:hypothetical protein
MPIDKDDMLQRMADALQWFINEDDTYRGDEPLPEYGGRTWDELNDYWIANLDSAIALVEEYNKSKTA